MGRILFPLFCTAEVSAETLSNILQAAYTSHAEASPGILFVSQPDVVSHPDAAQPSQPPISDLSDYPFLTYSIRDLANFLDSHNTEPVISSHHFLVADKQASQDHSILYVICRSNVDKTLETVRLDAAFANAIPTAVEVATLGIGEIQDAVDEDGIFRGGHSHAPPKKGKPAPRKPLVGKDGGVP